MSRCGVKEVLRDRKWPPSKLRKVLCPSSEDLKIRASCVYVITSQPPLPRNFSTWSVSNPQDGSVMMFLSVIFPQASKSLSSDSRTSQIRSRGIEPRITSWWDCWVFLHWDSSHSGIWEEAQCTLSGLAFLDSLIFTSFPPENHQQHHFYVQSPSCNWTSMI